MTADFVDLLRTVFTRVASELGFTQVEVHLLEQLAPQVVGVARNLRKGIKGLITLMDKHKPVDISGSEANQTVIPPNAQASIVTAACVYIVGRQNGRALCIKEVAAHIHEGPTFLSHVFRALKEVQRTLRIELEPATTTEFIVSALASLQHLDEERRLLQWIAVKIGTVVGEGSGITDGRAKLGVAIASILLAAELMESKQTISQLAMPRSITQRTINERVKELKLAIIGFARDRLGYSLSLDVFPCDTVLEALNEMETVHQRRLETERGLNRLPPSLMPQPVHSGTTDRKGKRRGRTVEPVKKGQGDDRAGNEENKEDEDQPCMASVKRKRQRQEEPSAGQDKQLNENKEASPAA